MAKKKWTPARQAKALEIIFQGVMEGQSIRGIIERENTDREILPSRPEFFRWTNDDIEIGNQYTRACAIRESSFFDEIAYLNETEKDAALLRAKQHALQWVLGRMNAKKYGNKLDVTSGGEPIKVQRLDLRGASDELLAEMERLANAQEAAVDQSENDETQEE